MKEETFDQLQKRIPERIIEHAVRGMLPKGRVRNHLLASVSSYLVGCIRYFVCPKVYQELEMQINLFN